MEVATRKFVFIIQLETEAEVEAINEDEGRGLAKGVFGTRFPQMKIKAVTLKA